ncbi:hypothetical protein HDU76_007040 [Blyttiomyces sp. JEL0837]|nr:hypothetical protein HDU76_007040 [Blyttiomyces sp. JEL0837]
MLRSFARPPKPFFSVIARSLSTTNATNDPDSFKLLLQNATKMNLQNVSIIRNPSISQCYEDAIRREPGTKITSTGALAALSGIKTGRSPLDKRIVVEENHKDNVWWGPVNIPLTMESFMSSRQRALDFLESRDRLYSRNAGELIIRPTPEELKTFGDPDFTIFNAGQFPANVSVAGITSRTSVELSLDRKELVILGTEYAGEMKKGVFTVMHYFMPHQNVLSLHSSANEGIEKKDVWTGKTTLSADPNRRLIGDDEHCWSADGIFNMEGGCYAKAIDLSAVKEPEIYRAIRYGSVLENVVLDEETGEVDYTNKTITENTRACYPIEYIDNAKIPCVGSHPTNIIFLTCDAFGVLPPVSRLTITQAMYHFISGYTAKVAGTEEGVNEAQATFSACFGQPFLVWSPIKYAEMLRDKLKDRNANVWLVNTGWCGGKVGVGERIKLKYSRAIIDAIHSGELSKNLDSQPLTTFPIFNLQIPRGGVPGVPDDILDPSKVWSSRANFESELKKLAGLFNKNFELFKNEKNVAELMK